VSQSGDRRPLHGIDGEDALERVRRRDELLSLLYWLLADRLHDAPRPADLEPFAGVLPLLDEDLAALVEAGLLAVTGEADDKRVRLTPAGIGEGRRRFEEEFTALPADGTAGNAHEVIIGTCGPNARCVRDGSHGECAEPIVSPASTSAG
jgi:hypothetical protein